MILKKPNDVGKLITICLCFFSLTFLSMGCYQNNPTSGEKVPSAGLQSQEKNVDKKVEEKNKRTLFAEEITGNTLGNIANGGIIAQQGEWIFYIDSNNGDELTKSKIDNSSKLKLSDSPGYYINVIGDWIYYANETNDNHIFRIRTNGLDKQQINTFKSYSLNVVNDWIYYVNGSDGNKIYKIKIDGTGNMKLNNYDSGRLNVVGGWIYYLRNKVEEGEHGDADYLPSGILYKIKIDGTNDSKVCDDEVSFFNVIGEWVYYNNVSDNLKLYKMKINGADKVKLNNDISYDINVSGNWIYYSNMSDNGTLYKIDLNSNKRLKMLDQQGKCWEINVIDGWIYYNYWSSGSGDESGLYKIKLDGSNKIKV